MSPTKRRSRRRYKLLAVLVLVAAIGAGAWAMLFRTVPVRHATPEAAFKHGTIGVEAAQGIPYWIWVVLPRVFPEHLPGPGGYTSLGFTWEDGAEFPVGMSKTTIGFPRIGANCAVCHTATWRADEESPRHVVPGGPTSTFSTQAYLRFLVRCAQDPRFTAENLMPEIEYLTKLSASEKALYRSVLIPQTRAALLEQGRFYQWTLSRPDWGPGRVDPFNPAKFGMLRRPVDGTIGNSDIMPVWSVDLRDGENMHWDGLNSSVTEVTLSSALGDGVTPRTLDPRALGRIEQWMRALRPPRNPFPVDPAQAARGEQVFAANCASCHGRPGAWNRRLVPLARPGEAEGPGRIGTDRHRAEMWDSASAETYNRYGTGYDWKFRRFKNVDAYLAPPLDGIWLRAPYLHNGSVPTLWHLLRPAERPERFYRGYDVVDPVRVGFRYDVAGEEGRPHFLYDTRLPGNSNRGHEFGASLPEEEKAALLEYLKTL
ncbi:MAG TPA: c-type cytochrome [Longimicrobium sp.]|nr:c-type cytochrome [Longimicrobium sp.]